MRGPRGEGVSFLGVVAVLVVDLGETLLPVGDAELGNVRRDAGLRYLTLRWRNLPLPTRV